MTTRRLAATVQHVLLFAVIAVLPSTAVAEPVRYSVGVKTWAADWGALNTNGEFRSYVGALFGPVAIARYRQVFVGATFFTGQLDFPFTQTVVNPPNITTTNTTIVAQRTDLDLTAGYYFLPTFGVIGGFKSVTFEFTIPPQPGSGQNFTRVEQTSSGPFVGLLGSYALGRTRFALYGNATYSFLQRELGGSGSGTSSFGGPSGEIGLAYRFPSKPVTLAEAYKFQRFESETGDSSDTFQGVIFSIAYTF